MSVDLPWSFFASMVIFNVIDSESPTEIVYYEPIKTEGEAKTCTAGKIVHPLDAVCNTIPMSLHEEDIPKVEAPTSSQKS